MVFLARCPICKSEQVGYNWTATKNGKKWLKNAKGQWHDCPKSTRKYEPRSTFSKYEKYIKLTSNDFDFCEFCDGFMYKKEILEKYPDIHGKTLTEHIEMFHPNGEILDEIDYMVLSDDQKEKKRKEWKKPKQYKKFLLKNKRVYNE